MNIRLALNSESCLLSAYFLILHLFTCVYVCTQIMHDVCKGPRTCRSHFFPSTTWILEVKLKLLELVAGISTH